MQLVPCFTWFEKYFNKIDIAVNGTEKIRFYFIVILKIIENLNMYYSTTMTTPHYYDDRCLTKIEVTVFVKYN